MKKTYEIPSVEMTQMFAESMVMAGSPTPSSTLVVSSSTIPDGTGGD